MLIATVLLAACDVGEVPLPGDPTNNGGVDAGSADNSAAAASYQSQIEPLVQKCLGCHSTTQTPTLTSFSTLQDKYKVKPGASNILVTKGDATAGMHEGIVYFTAAEKLTVGNWIDSLP